MEGIMDMNPSNPADMLEISMGLKVAMGTVCSLANIFKFWDTPYINAATDLKEMTILDKLYWVYKCRKPVIKGEKGSNIQELFNNGIRNFHLPSAFQKKETITLSAVGDLIPSEEIDNSKDILYENVSDLIFDSDISFANLESPITEQELIKEVMSDKESPVECCSRKQFNIIKGHRNKQFTVMHTAGNHIFDMGMEGIETTLKYFKEDGIIDLGTNQEEKDQWKGKILNTKGIKLGFVSATFGLNGKELPEVKKYMVNVAKLLPKNGEPDLSLLEEQIDFCIAEGCDFIIASLHWGYEFEFFPRKKQIEIAHRIIEHGVDAIIGHHPHVIQPVEYYQTQRDKNRIALIAYSLGSPLWSYSAPYLVLSEILNLNITKGTIQNEEKTYIEKATITPVFREMIKTSNSSAIQIKKLKDSLNSQKNTEKLEYLSEIKKYSDLVFIK